MSLIEKIRRYIRSWLKWLLIRCWPPSGILLAIGLHYAVIRYTNFDKALVNDWSIFLLQIGGGLLILWSLHDSISSVTGFGLLKVLWQSLPRWPKVVNVGADLNMQFNVASNGSITTPKNPVTVDERLAYLQGQVSNLQKELHQTTTVFTFELEK